MPGAATPARAMSPELIVEVARRMVESGGVEALSMRKLAVELGVAPTAIYWHVGGRDQLLHAVMDQLLTEDPTIRARGTTPSQRVASVARAIRRNIRSSPTLHQLAQHLNRSPDASFPGQLALTREVTAAGLHGEDAANAVRALLYLIGGFQLLDSNFSRRPAGARTTQELWRTVEDDQIDAQLRATMAAPADSDALFDYALDALLRSILV
jgi:TetR/AcrR family transcriptional regulator, tetracycline repressor protein